MPVTSQLFPFSVTSGPPESPWSCRIQIPTVNEVWEKCEIYLAGVNPSRHEACANHLGSDISWIRWSRIAHSPWDDFNVGLGFTQIKILYFANGIKLTRTTFCKWLGWLPPDDVVPQQEITTWCVRYFMYWRLTHINVRNSPSLPQWLVQRMANMPWRRGIELGLWSQHPERGVAGQSHNLLSHLNHNLDVNLA